MKIGYKIGLGFSIGIAAIAAMGIVSLQNLRTQAYTARWEVRTYQVLNAIETAMSTMKDAETGQRGFIITGRDEYLEPYLRAVRTEQQSLNSLTALTSDNPTQQAYLRRVKPMIDERFSLLREGIAARREGGFRAGRPAVLSDRGKEVMDQIRLMFDQMKRLEKGLMASRTQAAEASARFTRGTILIGAPLSFLVLAASGFVITRNVVRPLGLVARAARAISQGDLSGSLSFADRSDEIGQLEQSFSQMKEWLLRMADYAEQIAGQNLAVSVAPLSERDVLGKSFSSMVAGLRAMTDELHRKSEELSQQNKELERRVRERTAGLRRQAELLELAYEAVLVRDMDGRITFWNARAEELYGWTKDEAMGGVVYLLLETRFPVPFGEHMAQLTNEDRWEGELAHTTKDGREIIVLSRQSLQRDDAGNALAVLEINLDITAEKQAAEEIKRYASQLEASNRELQDFAFVASHDLQEPLRKIQAFGDQLRIDYGERLDAEGRDYLERMHSAAVRMQALIQALLNYSRVTTKAKPFSSTDLASVAHDVASDLEARTAETGGRVEIGDLQEIEADPTQMRQLIQNLLGNALKFHGDEKPLVKIYGSPAGDGQYSIFVEDNGIGFDEKYLDRIFTPFQRLHARGVYEGTGIGLAICRKIVDRHGGNITAKSAPGRGTTFIVTLPLRQSKGGT